MMCPRDSNHQSYSHTGVCIDFTETGTFLISAEDDKDIEVPEQLVQRCGLLVDIRDQDDGARRKVPVQLSVADAKSWLLCAELAKPTELVKQSYQTLLGALKVSPRPLTSMPGQHTLRSKLKPCRGAHRGILYVHCNEYRHRNGSSA